MLAGITSSGDIEDAVLLLDADESSAGMLCPARCSLQVELGPHPVGLCRSDRLYLFFLDEAHQ